MVRGSTGTSGFAWLPKYRNRLPLRWLYTFDSDASSSSDVSDES